MFIADDIALLAAAFCWLRGDCGMASTLRVHYFSTAVQSGDFDNIRANWQDRGDIRDTNVGRMSHRFDVNDVCVLAGGSDPDLLNA
jgi:hypothetical protein